ncbi:MAG: type I-E CRISPR-associated protein Cas6/Cse3/CasE [Spirochaetes bacterium]|nr:type I-E CRISPR-associated protein Cas6/Cse3/CasE [Spirochaetota bacterium]MBN2770109.1 type I-E CRISPR-associated protein Cas6/Cse3/CasE [Spirochaetota bacterium]
MYLSKLSLNLRSKEVRRDLADCYQMHRSIYNCFPSKDEGGSGSIVYRVEDYQNTLLNHRQITQVVLVVSEKEPGWHNLSDIYLSDNQIMQYAEKIECIANDMSFRFLLKANPTKKNDGKRIALRTYDDRQKWALRKAKDNGFELIDLSVRSDSIQKSDSKKGHELVFNTVYYEGFLRVTDVNLFKKALCVGIGSAKAFGYGLLTIAR